MLTTGFNTGSDLLADASSDFSSIYQFGSHGTFFEVRATFKRSGTLMAVSGHKTMAPPLARKDRIVARPGVFANPWEFLVNPWCFLWYAPSAQEGDDEDPVGLRKLSVDEP